MNLTYITKLNASTPGYSTRISYGPDFTQAELNAAVAAAHSITPEQAEAIGKAYFDIIFASAQPRRILSLFGLISVRPTSGGSSPTPDGFHNATDIRADWSLSMRSENVRDWRETCTIEKVGDEGAAVPIIESIINEGNGTLNTYTPNQMLHLVGDRLDFDKTDTDQGVFLIAEGGGSPIRLDTYGPIANKNVYVLVPGGLFVGPQQVQIINAGGHTAIYTTILTVAP